LEVCSCGAGDVQQSMGSLATACVTELTESFAREELLSPVFQNVGKEKCERRERNKADKLSCKACGSCRAK